MPVIKALLDMDMPLFGICLGLQSAIIEFARNVAGIADANSTEFTPECPSAVIDLMAGAVAARDLDRLAERVLSGLRQATRAPAAARNRPSPQAGSTIVTGLPALIPPPFQASARELLVGRFGGLDGAPGPATRAGLVADRIHQIVAVVAQEAGGGIAHAP